MGTNSGLDFTCNSVGVHTMFERLVIAIAVIGAASSQALADYGTVVAAPGPILGTGLSALVVAGVGAYAWYRSRKN